MLGNQSDALETEEKYPEVDSFVMVNVKQVGRVSRSRTPATPKD